MSDNNEQSFGAALSETHASLFGKQWAAWVGGILLAVTNIMLFAYEKPWSAADGVRNWGNWLANSVNLTDITIIPPHLYSTSVLNLGVLAGAFAASLMARQFRIQGAPPFELFKGLIGGILMGIGAAMAFGCNIGGFFSATSALSMAGLMMMLGLMIGVYLGLRLLILEINHLDFSGGGGSTRPENESWKQKQPLVGWIVLAAVIGLALIYDGFEYPMRGGFLLFGLFLGIVMQRTRFCFVRAFREPFMTGDGEMTKAVILAVLISVIGFTILKWTDLRDWDASVSSGFWIGSLAGGIIFGVGMSLSGGCATGCLWRAGEGQLKLWVAIAAFAVSGSLFRNWLDESGFLMRLGEPMFLPDMIGWKLAVAAVFGIMCLWYLLVVYNEAKKKFVISFY